MRFRLITLFAVAAASVMISLLLIFCCCAALPDAGLIFRYATRS